MQLYYLVEILIDNNLLGIGGSTAKKSIRIFDIDTHSMQLVELADFVVDISIISEDYIKDNLEEYDGQELIKL